MDFKNEQGRVMWYICMDFCTQAPFQDEVIHAFDLREIQGGCLYVQKAE